LFERAAGRPTVVIEGPINPVASSILTSSITNYRASDALTRALLFPALNVADFQQEILKIDHPFPTSGQCTIAMNGTKIPTEDVNSLSLPVPVYQEYRQPRQISGKDSYLPSQPMLPARVWLSWADSVMDTEQFSAIISAPWLLSNSPITPPLAYPNTRDRVPYHYWKRFSNLTSFGPYDNFSWKKNYSGDVSWTKGAHTMKFGAVYGSYRKNENAWREAMKAPLADS